MAFKVILTEPAFRDADEAAGFIAEESLDAARQWLVSFWQLLDTLKELPFRYAVIPEADSIGIAYRGVMYHSHRIIYRIDEERSSVYVIRVYHVNRSPLSSEDLRH
jgi:plasmid stabilization system protein ParE